MARTGHAGAPASFFPNLNNRSRNMADDRYNAGYDPLWWLYGAGAPPDPNDPSRQNSSGPASPAWMAQLNAMPGMPSVPSLAAPSAPGDDLLGYLDPQKFHAALNPPLGKTPYDIDGGLIEGVPALGSPDDPDSEFYVGREPSSAFGMTAPWSGLAPPAVPYAPSGYHYLPPSTGIGAPPGSGLSLEDRWSPLAAQPAPAPSPIASVLPAGLGWGETAQFNGGATLPQWLPAQMQPWEEAQYAQEGQRQAVQLARNNARRSGWHEPRYTESVNYWGAMPSQALGTDAVPTAENAPPDRFPDPWLASAYDRRVPFQESVFESKLPSGMTVPAVRTGDPLWLQSATLPPQNTQYPEPPLPPLPQIENIDNNITMASDHNIRTISNYKDPRDWYWYRKLPPWWFYDMVKDRGPWDLKVKYGPEYQDAGNWHYGAVAAAAGFSPFMIRNEAGINQYEGRNRESGPWVTWGRPAPRLNYLFPSTEDGAAHGDDPYDAYWINRGIRYYNENERRIMENKMRRSQSLSGRSR
jgi:hypothetical protein